MRILNIKIEVSTSFMGSRLRWRTNWWLCGTKSCRGKETLSSVLTNYSRTKPTLFTQDTARYTTLSWTCVLPYSILLLWEQARGTASVCGKIKAVGTFIMLNLSRIHVTIDKPFTVNKGSIIDISIKNR